LRSARPFCLPRRKDVHGAPLAAREERAIGARCKYCVNAAPPSNTAAPRRPRLDESFLPFDAYRKNSHGQLQLTTVRSAARIKAVNHDGPRLRSIHSAAGWTEPTLVCTVASSDFGSLRRSASRTRLERCKILLIKCPAAIRRPCWKLRPVGKLIRGQIDTSRVRPRSYFTELFGELRCASVRVLIRATALGRASGSGAASNCLVHVPAADPRRREQEGRPSELVERHSLARISPVAPALHFWASAWAVGSLFSNTSVTSSRTTRNPAMRYSLSVNDHF
jgi:hypothetical protein